MNWDDLKVARAVHKAGSFAAAGARLRINETTVSRRLARLERDLGVTLFEAVDGVRRPTTACEELVALAETMADNADRIANIGAADAARTDCRRIAATDSVATEVLAPNTAAFLAQHPSLALEFLASTENVNFSRWEADLAIRLHKPKKGDFVISKLADLKFFLFEPAEGGDFIYAYPEELDLTPESQFLMKCGLHQRARCTTKNLLVAKALIRSRRCCGVLPSFMCAELVGDPAFRVSKLPVTRGVWLLVQNHLRHDAPTREVIDWIRECFAAMSGS